MPRDDSRPSALPPASATVIDRRRFLALGAAALALPLVGGCSHSPGAPEPDGVTRLASRPGVPDLSIEPGLHSLGIGNGRDGLLYVPTGYDPAVPARLVVTLHGAGGSSSGGITPLRSVADEEGLVLLAPDSRARTWDMILGRWGPDVEFIDAALAWTFRRVNVAPRLVGLEGFSDGATYALSLGLGNGDLFSRIIAFSAGFVAPAEQRGRPSIFVAHGTADPVLPIDSCPRVFVPRLRRAGYEVTYEEFDGGHVVLVSEVTDAVGWLSSGWVA